MSSLSWDLGGGLGGLAAVLTGVGWLEEPLIEMRRGSYVRHRQQDDCVQY